MIEQVTDRGRAESGSAPVSGNRRLLIVLPWLLLLAALGARAWISQYHGLMYDEPVTLHLASSVREGQLPYVDFYEHHTPLPWYALAPLAPVSVWRLQRLLVAGLGLAGLLGLFGVAREAWGRRVALLCLLLAAVSPLWNRQGNMVIHDAFLVVGLVAAVATWWQAWRRDKIGWWLLAGACSGLAVLSKQTGILPALAIGWGTLWFTRSMRSVTAYLLGGLLTCVPWLVLYAGQYEALYNGFLGWNLAANAYLPANPKFRPFFNDVFWSHPVLWSAGIAVGLVSCRHFFRRFEHGDPRPLVAVAGLAVVLILAFNWFVSRQTFGQYYLQAVPLLALLAARGLDWLARRLQTASQRWRAAGRWALFVPFVYLAVLNPVMISLTPWTPDLEEKLAIAAWLREEVEEEVIWEPWVYYAHLADKDFPFPYPFLSIHSVRDDPSLPTITGGDHIALEEYLDEEGVDWIVLHDPLMPAVSRRLNQILMGGPDDWQLVRTYEVTRYASENGYQRSLWTPWWRPVVFNEEVAVWHRFPYHRQGGSVGELAIHNPGEERYVFLEILYPGGEDVYLLDDASWAEKAYELRWHQAGHAFFLNVDCRLVDQRSQPQHVDELVISVGFSDSPEWQAQDLDLYRVRLPAVDGRLCSKCAETWVCRDRERGGERCQEAEIDDVLQVSSIAYQPMQEGTGDETGGH
jgi:hypothetical protein